MRKIVMYTTPSCPYCDAAKSLLVGKGADFEEINVSDWDLREKMTARANGRRSVPQIFIGDVHVGGFDDMAALERGGDLDPLLA